MLAKAKHTVSAYQRETVPFLGLNRSDDTREGEFSEQKNMSDRRYPFLAPRLPRTTEVYSEPTALFAWDGKEILVDGGMLYYDGEALCNVKDGPKQFAVVNTKLVVWPDQMAVDLTNRNVAQLFVSMTNIGAAVYGRDRIKLAPRTVYSVSAQRYGSTGTDGPWIWTYSSVEWTEDAGWVLTDPQLTNLFYRSASGRFYIPKVILNATKWKYVFDMPDIVVWNNEEPQANEPEPANALGFYVELEWDYKYDSYIGIYGSAARWIYKCYWAREGNAALDKIFSVGDVVTVKGCEFPLLKANEEEKRKIIDIDTETNTLIFADHTFRGGIAYLKASGDILTYKNEYSVCFYYEDETGTNRYYRVGAQTTISAGQYAVLDVQNMKMDIYDAEYDHQTSFDIIEIGYNKYNTNYRLTLVSPQYEEVTVTREGPALDFICEHENRLWGVSNEDKTIYASALGDPNNFYDYTGESGGFAVAVGSEGDFTGICSYGNAVLCWKERTLHKVLGDLPSNYQTAVYRFAGVRSGAHKSLVNVNETLFFLGVDGVYAYTGNKPSLISRALGTDVLENGVGGTDGKAYYLSAKNGEAWELLSYDTHTGLWSRSDEMQVVDFCRVGDDVKFLAGDSVYTIGSGDEQVEWEAVFVPMYETLEGGKQYNRLIFRAEVPKGGWLAADVRFDDGRWIQVGIVKGKSGPVSLPIPLRRCDKFQIRLRGKGDCAVLDMVREFRLRGDG